MKKILALILAVLLIMVMAVTAFAVTPELGVPDVPQISDIEFDTKIELPDSFWDDWFTRNPISIPDITIPSETEPTEPYEPTEPDVVVTDLDTPAIYEAKYVHKTHAQLEIKWAAVENAESYLVMITKADGAIITYVTTENMLYLKDTGCPKVYVEKTGTWTAASVRVMAVTGDVISEWSDLKRIGCDMLH